MLLTQHGTTANVWWRSWELFHAFIVVQYWFCWEQASHSDILNSSDTHDLDVLAFALPVTKAFPYATHVSDERELLPLAKNGGKLQCQCEYIPVTNPLQVGIVSFVYTSDEIKPECAIQSM